MVISIRGRLPAGARVDAPARCSVGRGNPRAEVPAYQERARDRGEAAGALNHFADRRTEVDLDDAGARDRAEDRDEDGAGLVRRSAAAEPIAAAARDQADVRERLD